MSQVTLSSWMVDAAIAHPLRPLMTDTSSSATAVLAAYEELLATVESAAPTRWQSKRRDFRRLQTEQALLAHRGELVVAAKLIRAGIPFEFGKHDVPNPDLVLDSGLGVEVTAKAPEGVHQLYDDIDIALLDFPGCSVHLRFSDYPIRLRSTDRQALVEDIRGVAGRVPSTGAGGLVQRTVSDARNGTSIAVQAVVFPVPLLADGFRVTWETDPPGQLAVTMACVETEILSVLRETQKYRQAMSMPTLLAVDVGRLGPSVATTAEGVGLCPGCSDPGVLSLHRNRRLRPEYSGPKQWDGPWRGTLHFRTGAGEGVCPRHGPGTRRDIRLELPTRLHPSDQPLCLPSRRTAGRRGDRSGSDGYRPLGSSRPHSATRHPKGKERRRKEGADCGRRGGGRGELRLPPCAPGRGSMSGWVSSEGRAWASRFPRDALASDGWGAVPVRGSDRS